jgi:DNA-binding SARP family transcriptional activator
MSAREEVLVNNQQNRMNKDYTPITASLSLGASQFGGLWQTVKRVVRGELRLKWVERNGHAGPLPISLAHHRLNSETVSASPTPNGVPYPELKAPVRQPVTGTNSGPALTVYCLGAFQAYQNEICIEKWPGKKIKAIFKYLLLHREQPVNMEILMDLYWSDVEPAAARKSLYQAIYLLRQALQKDSSEFTHILIDDCCYYLNPELEVWVDSEVFARHYEIGQRLEREGKLFEAIAEYEAADSLYQGEFLLEDRYEDWPIVQREQLKHAHLDILDRLSRFYFEHRQWSTSIAYCQKILTEDSCREDAHQLLMRCYVKQGQPYLALRQYHLCVEALKRELEVPPMPATVELYQQIQENRIHFSDF